MFPKLCSPSQVMGLGRHTHSVSALLLVSFFEAIFVGPLNGGGSYPS